MKRIYFLIFTGLVFASMYLIVLIARDRYEDFQINSYISTLEYEKRLLTKKISLKQEELAYTYTPSYIDKAAKTSQNLKNPGEVVYIFPESTDQSDEPPSEPALIITRTQNERASRQINTWRYYLLEKTYQK